MTQKEREELVAKAEEKNEQIRRAIAVKTALESEGFHIIQQELKKSKEELENQSIRTFKGSVFEKGAMVENIQGGFAVLDALDELFNKYKKLAEEQPVDTAELRKIIINL